MFIQLLLSIGSLRFTTWPRNVVWQGETYVAAGALQAISLPAHALDPVEQALSFELALEAPEIKPQVEHLGPEVSEAAILYSGDGADWRGPAYRFRGLLSRCSVEGQQWSASIEKNYANLLVAEAEITHERQVQLHPGDLGLAFMGPLAQGQQIEWP